MFKIKRVLRNLLPGLRNSASLGLVTFKQKGYYRYYPANKRGRSQKTTVFFSKTEMERLGAWSSSTKRPQTSFTWNGTSYTLLSSTGLSVNRDSLYSRTDDVSLENRYRFSEAGQIHTDGVYTWKYRGSYYTYDQRPIKSFRAKIIPSYMGPQYTSGRSTYVYHRYYYRYTSQGISAASSGEVVEPLPSERNQAAYDLALTNILARMNSAANGGLWAWGGTPTGHAIHTAGMHFLSRQRGNNKFKGAADPAAACRPRYVLLLTDGQSNIGLKPYHAARKLFQRNQFKDNPVKTLVVGLPGLPSSAMHELDLTADMGDDGKQNYSRGCESK